MKSCPTCKRTFEDTLTFCLVDGSILSAPFDPHATLVLPRGNVDLPRTVPDDPSPNYDALPATIQSPPPDIDPARYNRSPHRETKSVLKQASEMDNGVYFAIAILVLIAIVVAVIIRNSY